jgi:surface protein
MKFTNETLGEAVKEWLEDKKSAEVKYGHISNWDTSEATDMSKLFLDAHTFNEPLNNWDVSNVTNMEEMFSYAYFFNQPIGNWDVSNVTDMEEMFREAKAFNKNISKWDVKKPIKLDDGWDITNSTWMEKMFKDAPTNMIETYGVNGEYFLYGEDFASETFASEDFEIYLMTEGTNFSYENDNGEEMIFEAERVIVECSDNEDLESDVMDALGNLILTSKGKSFEPHLISDLPDILDSEFTNSVGNLHNEPLTSIQEAVDFIKNLKSISFKSIKPEDGESIRYID